MWNFQPLRYVINCPEAIHWHEIYDQQTCGKLTERIGLHIDDEHIPYKDIHNRILGKATDCSSHISQLVFAPHNANKQYNICLKMNMACIIIIFRWHPVLAVAHSHNNPWFIIVLLKGIFYLFAYTQHQAGSCGFDSQTGFEKGKNLDAMHCVPCLLPFRYGNGIPFPQKIGMCEAMWNCLYGWPEWPVFVVGAVLLLRASVHSKHAYMLVGWLVVNANNQPSHPPRFHHHHPPSPAHPPSTPLHIAYIILLQHHDHALFPSSNDKWRARWKSYDNYKS